ncbi:hypothetical protein EGR52_03185 [bacterium]|nr:hypothetical protein [bacterium]
MNCIIPFTKDINFKTNIAKILSVSLEHEYTANPMEVLGNFTISGEYKVHEVSINKESFEYVLPFSVNLTKEIDINSVDFDIVNFTYEVVNDDTLRVNIEYSINAIELPEEKEEVTIDELLDEIDEDVRAEIEDVKEEKEEIQEKEEVLETENRDITDEAKETILNSINKDDNTYVTYHVHIMSETDTIESICLKYNVTESILKEYNDLTTIGVKDKVIIPENYE